MAAANRRVCVQAPSRCRFALGWGPPRRLLPAARRRRSANGSPTFGIRSFACWKEASSRSLSTDPSANWRHPGNANVCFEGFDAQDILGVLQPRLAASTGAACTIWHSRTIARAPGARLVGHVQSEASIRFSFGRFTSHDEIETAARLVDEALATVSAEAIIS